MAQTTALSNSALPGKVHVFTAKTAVVVVVFTTIFETPIVLDLHVMLLNISLLPDSALVELGQAPIGVDLDVPALGLEMRVPVIGVIDDDTRLIY